MNQVAARGVPGLELLRRVGPKPIGHKPPTGATDGLIPQVTQASQKLIALIDVEIRTLDGLGEARDKLEGAIRPRPSVGQNLNNRYQGEETGSERMLKL